jgi:hypothetical protein
MDVLANQFGQSSLGSGEFASQGDAQTSTFTLRTATTDATLTPLTLDGNLDELTVPNNTTWSFRMLLVATEQSAANTCGWEITGVAYNAGSGTFIMPGATVTPLTSAVPAGWSVALGTTSNDLDINVTGVDATNIRWVARVETTEVAF